MLMKKFLSVAAATFLACSLCDRALSQTVAPGIGVYDKNGVYVGNLIDQNRIWMKFRDGEAYLDTDASGAFVRLLDQASGRPIGTDTSKFFFTTRDCSGTRYLEVNGLPARGIFLPIKNGNTLSVSSGKIFYAKRPYERIVARSSLGWMGMREMTCLAIPDARKLVGEEGVFETRGFAPPLTIR